MYQEMYTDGFEALESMLDKGKLTRSQIAQALIDEGFYSETMTQSTAISRLGHCINEHKDSFFKFSEIMFIMQINDRYDPLMFLCDSLGFDRPKRKPTELFIAETLERVEGLLRLCGKSVEDIYKMQEQSNKKPVAPLDHSHRPARFSIDGF